MASAREVRPKLPGEYYAGYLLRWSASATRIKGAVPPPAPRHRLPAPSHSRRETGNPTNP